MDNAYPMLAENKPVCLSQWIFTIFAF